MADTRNRLRALLTSAREFDFVLGDLLTDWTLAGATEMVIGNLFSDDWCHDHNLNGSKADLRDCLGSVVVSARNIPAAWLAKLRLPFVRKDRRHFISIWRELLV